MKIKDWIQAKWTQIRGWFSGRTENVSAKVVLKSFEDITKNPGRLYGKSSDEVAAILGEEWTKGSYGLTGTGWKFTQSDKIVFYHTGGRHVGPYYGFASGTTGR